jgi:hypothetical protein
MLHGALLFGFKDPHHECFDQKKNCFGVDGYAIMPSASIQDICLFRGTLLINILVVIFV